MTDDKHRIMNGLVIAKTMEKNMRDSRITPEGWQNNIGFIRATFEQLHGGLSDKDTSTSPNVNELAVRHENLRQDMALANLKMVEKVDRLNDYVLTCEKTLQSAIDDVYDIMRNIEKQVEQSETVKPERCPYRTVVDRIHTTAPMLSEEQIALIIGHVREGIAPPHHAHIPRSSVNELGGARSGQARSGKAGHGEARQGCSPLPSGEHIL